MSTQLDLAWLDPSLDDLTRRDTDGYGSGLSRALAARFGIDVVIVRVAFVLLALSAGLGLALYGWGTALTRGPAGNRPIDSLLPSFGSWTLRSQKLAVVISSLAFTFAVAASTPLPWGTGVIALIILVFLRRKSSHGAPVKTPADPGSVDEQLASWRARMAEAAGTRLPATPTLDLDAPAARTTAAPAPVRAKSSWLAGLAIVAIAGCAGVFTSLVLGGGGVEIAAVTTITAGVLVALYSLIVRQRRIPRLILGLLVVAIGATGYLATQSTIPAQPAPGVMDLGFIGASDETLDLSTLDLEGFDEIVVHPVASNLEIVVPGEVGEIVSHKSFSNVDIDPALTDEDAGSDLLLERLVIDATASNVDVVQAP